MRQGAEGEQSQRLLHQAFLKIEAKGFGGKHKGSAPPAGGRKRRDRAAQIERRRRRGHHPRDRGGARSLVAHAGFRSQG